jgi:hypothetical protein
VYDLRRTYHRLRNSFECNRWNSLVMCVMWNLSLVHLESVLVSLQDRRTVCVECTIGSESFWMHPIELLDDVRHVDSHFGMFGDSVSVVAR